jgi:hypothetical protein
LRTRIRRAGRGADQQDNTPPPVADDQLGRAFLRAVRRRLRRFMRWLPPPVCGPAFGSCSGGASGGDAWASASDTVNTSAGGTAMVNPASPRRESALRREITSDVLISNLPDFEVDEKADNRAYRGRVADQGPGRGPLLPGLIKRGFGEGAHSSPRGGDASTNPSSFAARKFDSRREARDRCAVH